MTRYLALAFIVAARLPDRAEIAPDIVVERLGGERLDEVRRSHVTLEHPSLPGRSMYSVRPVDVRVTSAHALWMRVTAGNHEEAAKRVTTSIIPLVVTAIDVLGWGPAVVDLVRIGPETDDGRIGEPQTPWSTPGQFRSYGVVPLDAPSTTALSQLTADLRRDSNKHQAARMFAAARHLDLISAGLEPVVRAALLSYFQVIELVARHVVPGGADDEAIEAHAKRIATLRQGLSRGSTKAHVAQVRNAAKDIDRQELKFLNLKIEGAAEALGVSEDSKQAAIRLADLRNTRLSHPGGAETEQLESWIGVANQTALEFLTAWTSP